jgi:uncharacterized membrane protein (DUF4010 family)
MVAPDLVAVRLLVGALSGLAVGVEREWSAHERRRGHHFAGLRTFTLIGVLGGLSGVLADGGFLALAVALLSAPALLVLAAFVIAARGGDLDSTSEVAGFLVLGAGLFAGLGELALASGVGAVTALLLVEKGRLHAAVEKLRSVEIEAALRFAVLALVVLPLLPTGPFGPDPGVRPRELWALVLIFSGLSFAGYVALRAIGPQRGYALAGLLGGLVSSTAVTFNFSRHSRQEPALGEGLALGVVAACTTLCVRVPVLAAVINPEVGMRVARLLVLPLAVGIMVSLRELRGAAPPPADPAADAPVAAPPPSTVSPLGLGAAVKMTLLFAVVFFAVSRIGAAFGSLGIYGSAAVVALTDMDALTYSMAKAGGVSATYDLVARAILVGVVVNTLFKLAVALTLGRGRFRTVVGFGLAGMALAAAAGFLW